jgi:hypothetical protein
LGGHRNTQPDADSNAQEPGRDHLPRGTCPRAPGSKRATMRRRTAALVLAVVAIGLALAANGCSGQELLPWDAALSAATVLPAPGEWVVPCRACIEGTYPRLMSSLRRCSFTLPHVASFAVEARGGKTFQSLRTTFYPSRAHVGARALRFTIIRRRLLPCPQVAPASLTPAVAS